MESYKELTFIISILLHALLYVLMLLSNYRIEVTEKEPPKTWLEFEDQRNRPMMSDTTKRVEKQTRTKITSPAAISALQPPTTGTSLRSLKDLKEQSFSQNEEQKNSLRPSTNSGDLFMSQSARASSSTVQQIQSYLPQELELGDMVALNTDQNLFYTFYRRMNEKLVWPWAQSVTAAFEKLKAQGQLGSSRKAWVTILEVLLDKNGNVVSTQPLQLAGEWDMDSAPVNAFKSAKTFPNPPIEMVEEDGYIRIKYKFVVYYTPGPQR